MHTLTLHEPVITYRTRTRPRVELSSSDACADRFRELFAQLNSNPTAEAAIIITVNCRSMEVGYQLLTMGCTTQTIVSPADTLRTALLLGGTGFILAHNHPSGDPSPSAQDVRVTRSIREGAAAVDLHFLDHLILGDPSNDPAGVGHYSFRSAGLLPTT